MAMFVSNRDPLTNPRQVFEGECLARYGGFSHQGFREAVVDLLLEATFAAHILPEAALRVLGADFLESLTAQVGVVACGMDQGTGALLARASGSEVHDAQVSPQDSPGHGAVQGSAALGDVQLGEARAPDQISPANLPHRVDQQLLLTRTAQQAADDTSIPGVEGDAIQAHAASGACVVADAPTRPAVRARLAALRLDGFARFKGLRSRAHGQLSAQPVGQSRLPMHTMVGRIAVGDPRIPAHPRDPGRRFVEGALRRGQNRVMAVNVQLATDGTSERFVHEKMRARR